MPLASRAHEATVLLTQLGRRPVLPRIRELYPDCRFSYEAERLYILCPSSRWCAANDKSGGLNLPKALKFKASAILEIFPDGTYRRVKSKVPIESAIRACLGLRDKASDESVVEAVQNIFEENTLPEPVPPSPSCWARLGDGDDDDWEE